MTTKPSNPKDAVGVKKVPIYTVIPWPGVMPAENLLYRGTGKCLGSHSLAYLALALMEGALKYGRHNYREIGVRASVYVDAVGRHYSAERAGQLTDPDSGLPHVVKAAAGLVVLRDCIARGNWVDDRPPPSLVRISDREGLLVRWWEGQNYTEGGDFLIDALLAELFQQMNDLLPDDPKGRWLDSANSKAAALLEKYPSPMPAAVAAV